MRPSTLARLLWPLALLALLGGPSQAQAASALPRKQAKVLAAPLSAPGVAISLGGLGPVTLGADFSFTVTFDNNGTDPGYGPFIDILFPVNGADGAQNTSAPLDGIDFLSATYLGQTFSTAADNLSVLTFPGSGGVTCVNHPWAVDGSGAPIQVCGPAGDKLVSIRLPFGSFTPDQPPATVTVNAHLSEYADVGTPLTIRARGGYMFGANPLDDWCCGDLPIVVPPSTDGTGWPSGDVTPVLLNFAKAYVGPGNTQDETATGPNFPRQYTLTVDIADGQTITNLTVTDILPDNLQYLAVSSTPAFDAAAEPSTTTPGGTLSVTFNSVTGAPGDDVTITVDFYVPRLDAGGDDVIDPATGDDATSDNIAWASGDWTPLDSRDAPTTVSSDPTCPSCPPLHTLQDKSIAIQKSVAVVGGSGPAPGQVLEYTLTFQVSDYFAFGDIVVTDVISDGQHVDGSFTPTLEVNGNPYTLPAAAMDPANFDVVCNYSGGPGAECDGDDPAPDDGTTTLTFRVSDEIVRRGESGDMLGGCVNPAGGRVTPCDPTNLGDGPTTATIVFRTVILDEFTDTFPSGDPSVDQGDLLTDTATVAGNVLDVTSFAPTETEDDDAAASTSIAYGDLTKSIYALNGSTSFSTPVEVKPGDEVTYRITYTLPTSDFENLVIDDYLPLPVFDATEVATFSNTICGIPAAGASCLGPSDTYHSLPGALTPTLSTDPANNRITWTYGDDDRTGATPSSIDLLFTVTVSGEPFADRLYLTNQAHAVEGSTNAGSTSTDAIVQIILTEPVLATSKAVIWTSNPSNVFSPSPPGPVTFLDPSNAPRWSGTINSTNLAATPIDSNVGGVDAGDIISFAIVIENQGSSLNGAFDIQIQDTLPAEYQIPAGGLNLQIYYGDGTGPIPYRAVDGSCTVDPGANNDPCGQEIFQEGIELIDPVGQGVCQAHDPNSGNNIILITYDLQLRTSVTPGDIVNTESLLNYAGTEGGPNHLPQPQTDDAIVTVNASPTKFLMATSEAHTSGSDVAVGEIVRYRIVVRVPEGTSPNFQVRDLLPSGLTFLDDGTAQAGFVSTGGITSTGIGIVPAIPSSCNLVGNTADATTPASLPCTLADGNVGSSNSTASDPDTYNTGTDPYFKLGDLVNDDRDDDEEYVVIEFNALVDNTAAGSNDDGDRRNDRARAYVNGSQMGSDSASVRVTVREPFLTLDKTHSAIGATVDAGDTVTYTVTIANPSATSGADAFDVHFTDTLPADLTLLLPVTVTPSGGATGVTDNSSGNTVDVTVDSIPLDGQVVITYQASVNTSVTPSQALDNTGDLTWTSLPGTGTSPNPTGSTTPGGSGQDNGERDGSDGVGGAVDDYEATAVATLNIHDPLFSKSIDATSAPHTAGNNAVIGEVVTFGLLVTLPEGTTPSLRLVDDIPDGMAYLSGTYELVTQTNPPATCGSLAADFNGTFTAGDPVVTASPGVSGADITFDFGQIVVNADNDDTNNAFLICLQALVLNEAGNQNGDTLTNSATLTVTSNNLTDTQDVNVLEPELQVTKTVTDPNPAPGEVVTFTLTVNHAPTSAADAFDVLIYDDLPAGLALDLASITVTPSPGLSGVTNNSAGSRVEVAVDTFPQGETLTITFDATVTAAYGAPITNTAYATWTSLPGADANERTGADGVGGSPNDYAASGSVTLNADRDLSKALVATSLGTTTSPDVTIGEILTYQIVLTIPAGSTDTAVITDSLAAGLAFLDCSQITAGPNITSTRVDFTDPDNCNHGTTPGTSNPLIENDGERITFDLGDITNSGSAPENIVLTYRVVVLDTVANQSDVTLDNDVEWTWATGRLTASAPLVRITEPDLGLEKSVNRRFALPGGELAFTLRVFHTAESQTEAYDVVLRDVIPEGLNYVPGSLRFVPGSGAAPTTLDDAGTDPATGRPLLVAAWDSLPPGMEARIEFRARMGNLGPGQSVTNIAEVEWSTLPGDVSTPQSVYNALSTERRYDPLNPADVYRVESSVAVEVPLLPATGFAPGRVTPLPEQPVAKTYRSLGNFVLEIPRLGVQAPIVGVPLREDAWDLRWLWDQVGYLEGTAYPTWPGNTVLTAHVYTADGRPGPFFGLDALRWGDRVIIHASGYRYVYEVREVRQAAPDDPSAWQHEVYDWVTLVTCKEYDEARGTYRSRVIVRAVLVAVEGE